MNTNKPKTTCSSCGKIFINLKQHETKMHSGYHVAVIVAADGVEEPPIVTKNGIELENSGDGGETFGYADIGTFAGTEIMLTFDDDGNCIEATRVSVSGQKQTAIYKSNIRVTVSRPA
jgi:hypothetical protein